MPDLDALLALEGSWQATYELRGDPSFEGDSPSTATVAGMLDKRCLRIDYTWSYRGTDQQGLLIVGREHGPDDRATVLWLDSWHNQDRMMVSRGAFRPDGGIDVRGSWPAGDDGPDWGWRTVLAIAPAGWTMTMYVVTPAGEEALGVNAAYRRG
jgi:Protein of unknown function (DUF1579)